MLLWGNCIVMFCILLWFPCCFYASKLFDAPLKNNKTIEKTPKGRIVNDSDSSPEPDLMETKSTIIFEQFITFGMQIEAPCDSFLLLFLIHLLLSGREMRTLVDGGVFFQLIPFNHFHKINTLPVKSIHAHPITCLEIIPPTVRINQNSNIYL